MKKHPERRPHFIGPILTNNFDGLTSSLGLPHALMRAFDTVGSYPKFEFHPDDKSLLVFGCHADRRTSQWQARKHGLKVIYVDPRAARPKTASTAGRWSPSRTRTS